MSQRQHDKPAAGEQNPVASDRREFIRQSLGVAPLMLTLGRRGPNGEFSMHGTLWSSLDPNRKHNGDWWRFNRKRWRWTKNSGDNWRDRGEHAPPEWKEAHPADEIVTKPKDWDWDKSEDRWQRELDAKSKRNPANWRREPEPPTTDRSYDWRDDDEWKRSEGLSPSAHDTSKLDKD